MSVYGQTYPYFDIIFVDNGSEDDSVEFVTKTFPETRIIKNKKNIGFAEGNNVGIRASNTKYIVALNNDTKVDSSWLEELVRIAETDKRIGSCASKMLRYDDPAIIDSAGIELLPTGAVRERGGGTRDCGQYDKMEEVFGACAGAALYRREMLDEIGLFPSHYFASYEDVDLAWQARYSGWKCFYVPSAVVYHIRFATQWKLLAEEQSFLPQKIRNQIWYRIKYTPTLYLIKNLPHLIELYFKLLAITIKNKPSVFSEMVKVLPSVLSARHKYHSNMELDKNEILRWLEGN